MGSIAAVFKHDTPSAPTAVYNEYVAARLGELLHINVAAGVLTKALDGNGMAYASLIVAGPGGRLPHIVGRLSKPVVEKYQWEAAGLFVFDVLIGNWDRGGNVKAWLSGGPGHFISGFDHANALLMSKSTCVSESTSALEKGDPILCSHMFAPYLSKALIAAWSGNLRSVPSHMFESRCCIGMRLNDVAESVQEALAQALVKRVKMLPELCAEVLAHPLGRSAV